MDLNSRELPDKIKTIEKEDTVKKIMYYKKMQIYQQAVF